MILTDTVTQAEITLPDDLLWTDEFTWTPVAGSVSYSLAGSLLVEGATKLTGRPISLDSPPEMAWVTRSTVEALYDLSAIALRKLVLAFSYPEDTRSFNVIFAPGTPVTATPVKGFISPSKDDYFYLKLRFLEV